MEDKKLWGGDNFGGRDENIEIGLNTLARTWNLVVNVRGDGRTVVGGDSKI